MNEKIINVFFGSDNLPYKDIERQIHFPVSGSAFLGASNTTKIRFYFDYIGNVNTTWVSVAKLPNGKQGSKVLNISSDDNGNYAELELSNWYTQAKGDVYIALQGYQGGVEYSYDSETELYEITGTPTIQTTGSIKLAINYAPIGQVADYNDEFTTYQEILAALGDKADISSTIIVVNDITQVVATTYEDGQLFYNLADRKLYQLNNSSFVVFQPYVVISSNPIPQSDFDIILAHKEYPIIYGGYVYWYYGEDTTALRYVRNDLNVSSNTFTTTKQQIIIFKNTKNYNLFTENAETYNKSKIDTELSGKADKSTTYTKTETDELLSGKQNTLVSGTNIKSLTVDGVEKSLLGSGTIEVGTGGGGGAWGEITGDIQDQTDLQNELQDIREVAEGKNKTLVLSYSASAPTTDIQAQTYKKPDGTAFASLSQFNSYVSGLTLRNSIFNSQDTTTTYGAFYLISNDNIVYRSEDMASIFKVGDIVLITQTDVPDRWVSAIGTQTFGYPFSFSKLETTKIDLTNYATTGDLAMAKYEIDLMLAPEYNIFTTYAIGDKVVHDNKLYTCTTAITTPESWDSTHWTQISVASGFVDLTGTQVITGEKTFDELLKTKLVSTYQWQFGANGYNFVIERYNGNSLQERYYFTTTSFASQNGSDLGNSVAQWKDLYLSGSINLKGGTKEAIITCDSTSGLIIRDATTGGGIMTRYITGTGPAVIPYGASSLGHPNAQWKDLYLNGTIYGASNVFNVINASDIVSNTLTQAQYDLITNGKPTLISGTFGTRNNIELKVGQEYGGYYCCECTFNNQYGAHYRTAIRIPTTSPYTLSFNDSGIYFNYQGNNVSIPSLNSVNGKNIPAYPSNTGTFVLKCVDGVLTWVAE